MKARNKHFEYVGINAIVSSGPEQWFRLKMGLNTWTCDYKCRADNPEVETPPGKSAIFQKRSLALHTMCHEAMRTSFYSGHLSGSTEDRSTPQNDR